MPAFMLKRQILINLPSDKLEMDVANSIDFMVERVELLLKIIIIMTISSLLPSSPPLNSLMFYIRINWPHG